MPRTAIIFSLFLHLFGSRAFATSCGRRILAFNQYDQVEAGVLQKKYSVFPVGAWSANSSFEGLIVLNKDPSETLAVTLGHRLQTSPLESWTRDEKYRSARQFVAFSEADVRNREFTLKLLKKNKVLCQDTYAFLKAEGDKTK